MEQHSEKQIRVLIVDDSLFMRTLLAEIIRSDPRLRVAGTAKDGYEAIEKVTELKPDVITMDVEMPRMNGLQALGYIMSECPTPVVMLSAYTSRDADITLKALEYGAIDFIPKPSGSISLNIKEIQARLVEKIYVASQTDVSKTPLRIPEEETPQPVVPPPKKKKSAKEIVSPFSVVVIGASTGGPRALADLVSVLPKNLPVSFIFVQHMPPTFTHSFANRLNLLSGLEIKEAGEGDVLANGFGFVAPGGFHLEVGKTSSDFAIRLNRKPALHGVRPAVDITMMSVVEHFGERTLGVILTGMGKDGARGMRLIKEEGGATIVQDKDTSVVFGMPQAAIALGAADQILPLSAIPYEIISLIKNM